MSEEESEEENDILNPPIPKWMLEHYPSLHYLQKVPKQQYKPTINLLLKRNDNHSMKGNNQMKIPEGANNNNSKQNEMPTSCLKEQKNNQDSSKTDNDNIYKRYFDEYVSRLKGSEYNTALLNVRPFEEQNDPNELMTSNVSTKINKTNTETKGIANIMKSNFFASPFNQSNRSIPLNTKEEIIRVQNHPMNLQNFQSNQIPPKSLVKDDKTKNSYFNQLQFSNSINQNIVQSFYDIQKDNSSTVIRQVDPKISSKSNPESTFRKY